MHGQYSTPVAILVCGTGAECSCCGTTIACTVTCNEFSSGDSLACPSFATD